MAHEKGTVFRNTQWAKTLWPCSGSLCTIMDCHNIRKYSLIRKLSNKLITLVCARRERVPSTYIFVLICIFLLDSAVHKDLWAVADNLSAHSPPPCFSIITVILTTTTYYKKMDLM